MRLTAVTQAKTKRIRMESNLGEISDSVVSMCATLLTYLEESARKELEKKLAEPSAEAKRTQLKKQMSELSIKRVKIAKQYIVSCAFCVRIGDLEHQLALYRDLYARQFVICNKPPPSD